MKKTLFSFLLSSAALTLALVGNANATTITIGGVSVRGQGEMTAVAGATTTTFNGLNSMASSYATHSTPNRILVQGDSANKYKAPTNDCSTYVYTGTGSIVDTLAAGTSYFGFYWGSLDLYNDFSITSSNSSTFDITGAQLASDFHLAADGDSSYFVNFFAAPGTSFTSAAFSSSTNSLEFDNVASASPEPASVAMLAGGLLVIAGAVRRRKA